MTGYNRAVVANVVEHFHVVNYIDYKQELKSSLGPIKLSFYGVTDKKPTTLRHPCIVILHCATFHELWACL